MRRISSSLFLLLLLVTLPARAHVTPNVQLVARGEFIKSSLPAAAHFFEKTLRLGAADRDNVRRATGWTPSAEDTKVYVGRDAAGALVGTVVFVWAPSQHGPLAVAVAFDAKGEVLRAAVTDVGSEPLNWVQPLLDAGGLAAFTGLAPGEKPDPAKVAPQVHGNMSRYYAEVIAQGVERAQAVERLAGSAATTAG